MRRVTFEEEKEEEEQQQQARGVVAVVVGGVWDRGRRGSGDRGTGLRGRVRERLTLSAGGAEIGRGAGVGARRGRRVRAAPERCHPERFWLGRWAEAHPTFLHV
jgi:hypothetical protein